MFCNSWAVFKTPFDDYRELCYLIYWGRASVILEILLTNQYNGMIDGFEHCSIVDHVSEEVRYVFSHLAIYRKVLWMESWCGAVAKWWTRLVWSLSVVIFGIPEGCQMDEKPYDSTICGEWTFIFQLCWYPAWLLIPPFASSLARSKAGGSASMVALLKGDSQEQVRVGMARESLRDPKILWIPRVYPLVN